MILTNYQILRNAALCLTLAILSACGGGGGGGGGGTGPLAPSGLSYSTPQIYLVGTAITTLMPAVTGTVTSYSVTPALPAGLILNTGNGQISGTPTTAAAAATYTISASNSAGSATFGLSITVNNPTAPGAATVTVSYGVKQVILSWSAVADATYYQVLKNPDGIAGFAQIGADLTALSYADAVPVALTDWVNVRYQVRACNSVGCSVSAAISGLDATQAMGYFKASNPDFGDLFGYINAVAISVDGNTMAVGAYQEASGATGINSTQTDNATPGAGAVYVFVRNAGVWEQQAYVKASNTGMNDYFGGSVALSTDGSTLVVGAFGEFSAATGVNGDQSDRSAALAGAAYVFTRNGSQWSQQAYLKASNTNANDQFGTAVALSGDGTVLAVGAPNEASAATGIDGDQASNTTGSSGATYVFVLSAGSWSQQAYIKASNTRSDGNFGIAIALNSDGTTLAVGSPYESSSSTGINGDQSAGGTVAGAAYVFVRAGTHWSQQAYVKPSNAGGLFGSSIALNADGSTLAVGATFEASAATGIDGDQSDSSASRAGAAYVYTRTAQTWSQQAYIKASNTETLDSYGTAVALSADGSTLAVGAPGESSAAAGVDGDQSDDSASNAGAAYVYRRSAGLWSQLAYIKPSNTSANDSFGSAMAMSGDGNTLAVGAYGDGGAGPGVDGAQTGGAFASGAVYLY